MTVNKSLNTHVMRNKLSTLPQSLTPTGNYSYGYPTAQAHVEMWITITNIAFNVTVNA